jgi:hypothetical protein
MISPYDAGFLFVFKAWRRAHSWDYVTEAATLKTGEKTSKMGRLFASKSLKVAGWRTMRCGYLQWFL